MLVRLSVFIMKTICVLLSCFLALTVTVGAQDDVHIAKDVAECKKEMGIVESKDSSLSSMDDVIEQNKPCLYFCLLKKNELMNENGTINKKEFIFNVVEGKKELAEKTIDSCEKSVKPVDGCKMAACVIAGVEKKPKPGESDDK